MNKITGNEPATGFAIPEGVFVWQGMPIRLHIAASCLPEMLRQYGEREGDDAVAFRTLQLTDALIAAYNNTPNPNE